MRTVFAVLAAAVLAGSGVAQDPPKPGKEHEVLKKMEGTWDVVITMGGKETKGTSTYKMELGGFWLTGTFEGEMFGQKFTGKSSDGYCPIKKKYTNYWTDNVSSSPIIMTGDYDAAKKTMTMTGEGPGQDAKAAKYKSVLTWTDDDTFTQSLSADDAKEPMFTAKYTRKKK